ncbi:MAG TPA: hypothetical protein VJW55_09415 [Candidatus Angelobacter sp.]|nr:hypothetical protein [Candidatus Angelobacter sp.]HWG39859.1 hypothetical protein [Candidatus Acidoferrales bacterium]
MLRRAALLFSLVLSASVLALGQSTPITVNPGSAGNAADKVPTAELTAPHLKPSDLDSREALNNGTKMELIRLVEAEFGHTRKYFPVGEKNLVIEPDGTIKPDDAALYKTSQTIGAAAKIGDKVQITNIAFHEKSIYLEINGGPKKKTKWYQHIQISGMGGSTGGVDPNAATGPTGAALTVEFKKHVPEMTGAELHSLLSPVLDFSVKSAAEVFADTLPPKLREAVKKHEVLVGMNHDMVVMAKDRPQQKVREKDEQGHEYEEWIYGAFPQDVVFVRFIGDEVTQVKIAKVGGEMIVKTQKEVDIKDGVPTLASLKASNSPEDVKAAGPQPEQPAHAPTLKRPDEQPDPAVHRAGTSTPQTQTPAPPQEEPQWGTHDKQQPGDTQQQQPQDTSQQQQDTSQQPPDSSQQPSNTSQQPPDASQQPPDAQQPSEPELPKRPPL